MTILLTTGQDLKTLVLSRAGDDAVSPDFASECETYLQSAYVGVVRSFPWLFARKSPPGVFNTVAEITTGGVTLTNGSTAGAFSVAPAVSVAGRKIYTESEGIVCRIKTHTAGATAFTLDAAYPGDGGAAVTYALFQDEYSLASDFLEPVNTTRFLRDCHGAYDMDLVSPNRLDAMYPSQRGSSAAARYCAIIREKTIRLSPSPVDARRYEYEYVYHPGTLTFDGVAATDTPIIEPAEDRIVIAYAAAAELMVDLNDDRWSTLAAAGPEKVKQMKAHQRRQLKQRMFVRSQFSVGAQR